MAEVEASRMVVMVVGMQLAAVAGEEELVVEEFLNLRKIYIILVKNV